MAISIIGGAATVPAGTTGAVQFNNSGAFAADTSKFFWDDTNNRLGVGTSSPVTILHIAGDAPVLRIQNTGSGGKTIDLFAGTSGVGIGSSINPQQLMITEDAPSLSLVVGASRVLISTTEGIASGTASGDLYLKAGSSTGDGSVQIQGFNSTNNWETVFQAPGRAGKINAHLVTNGGLVSINHTSPQAQLDIHAVSASTKGLIVQAAAAQTADLTQWQNSSGTALSSVDKDGTLTAAQVVATGVVRLKGYTVATLPAGTVGDTAYVTDALAPTFLGVLMGGGAITTTAFYNGSNWVAQ